MFFKRKHREALENLILKNNNLEATIENLQHSMDRSYAILKQNYEITSRYPYLGTSVEEFTDAGYKYLGKFGAHDETWIRPKKAEKKETKAKAKKKKR